VHNTRRDLGVLGQRRFDLIYSDLVLQHMLPALSLSYIDEFLRLLAPGGLLVFQLPSHRRTTPPPTIVPMATSAYRARLDVVDTPSAWTPGSTARVHVRVVNSSEHEWDQTSVGAIRLGNHWLSPDGAMLVQDDGRSPLPRVLEPGEFTHVTLGVTVPPQGEDHILELDLVHEGYSWFADQGCQTTRLSVAVKTPGTHASDRLQQQHETWDESLLEVSSKNQSTAEVAFPMHGIPHDEVLAFVMSRGAETVFVEDDDRGGHEWVGFRYFIRQPASETNLKFPFRNL